MGRAADVMRVVGAIVAPSMPGDVGFNLPASEPHRVRAGEFAQVSTGIRVELPEGYFGLILPRSSANRSGAIVALPWVIDNGYRGELTVMLHNVYQVRPLEWLQWVWRNLRSTRRSAWGGARPGDVVVPAGHSLGQLVLFPATVPEIEQAGVLSESARGEGDYGSTGAVAHVERG